MLLRNEAPVANAVLVRAVTTNGRDAIGARLELRVGDRLPVDEVRSGGSFISQGDLRVHFRLGRAKHATLNIRWPNGATEEIGRLRAGQLITVRQGGGVASSEPLKKAVSPPASPGP